MTTSERHSRVWAWWSGSTAVTTDADSLAQVYATYDKWLARADSARERIAKAQRTLDGCYRHLGSRTVIEQVRDLLVPHFPRHRLEVLGPFGLTHEVAIHVVDVPTGATVAGVSFRPADGMRLHLVDWSRNTGQYPPNSLGARNQLNYDTFDEPATLPDIIAALDEQIADHERRATEEEA